MAKPVLTDRDYGGVARLLNVPNPLTAQEPATRSYVDSAIEGLSWKDSARVSTQANINLAAPGASIDGITMAANNRVLVRAQTDPVENGIYIWNGDATPMTRSLDASTYVELEQAVISVEEGSGANTTYRQTGVNGTVGVTPVTWTTFGAGVGSASETLAGVAEIATQAETNTGTDDGRIVTPLKLANWSGRRLKYSADLGDGAATSYPITHNLGTRDVSVTVFENGGSYREVGVEAQHTTINSVTLLFAAPPSLNSLRVVVLG